MSATPAGLLLPPGFLINPTLLWTGLGLASIPLIIHLLNRRRVRRRDWAAMTWLLAAMKRHQRRLRLEHWLMLLLRMAAVALLGLAWARPVLTDSALAGLVGARRSVVLVVDTSYSTLAKVDARSVAERIQQEAGRLLDGLGPEDALAVVVTNDPDEADDAGVAPFVLRPRSVGGEAVARARQALAALHPRPAPAPWPATFERVREQLAPEDPEREIWVLTDFQALDWAPGASAGSRSDEGSARGRAPLLAALEDVLRDQARVRIVDVGGSDRRNLTVESVAVSGGEDAFAGRPLRLEVVVANHGATAVTGATVEIAPDGEASRRAVRVPEIPAASVAADRPVPGRQTVYVDLPALLLQQAGWRSLKATILPPADDPGVDALGLDSERAAIVHVRPQIRVLAWTETSRTEISESAEDYLRGVFEGEMPSGTTSPGLEPDLPWFFTYRGVRAESELLRALRDRGNDPLDLVVLANAAPRDPRTLKELRDFVSAGGGLLVFLGDQVSDPAAWNEPFFGTDPSERLLPFPVGTIEERDRTQDGAMAFDLDLEPREGAHPVARAFVDPSAEGWLAAVPPRIWGRMVFRQEPSPDGGPTTPREPSDAAAGRPGADPVVLRYADGAAAVVAGGLGEGRTLWVGTSLDNGWLGEAVFFRPILLEEAGRWLTASRAPSRVLEVGGRLRARVPRLATQVRLTIPGGRQVTPTLRDIEGNELQADVVHDALGATGVWTLTYETRGPDGEIVNAQEPFAVVPAAREGALGGLRHDVLPQALPEGLDIEVLDAVSASEAAVDDVRRGEITRALLWALLALLVIESLLAVMFGRARAAAPTSDQPTDATADATASPEVA
ncbi:MAG: BatA domain-containing protein [Planctomycetota bacterium]